jgi:hypothetical protein
MDRTIEEARVTPGLSFSSSSGVHLFCPYPFEQQAEAANNDLRQWRLRERHPLQSLPPKYHNFTFYQQRRGTGEEFLFCWKVFPGANRHQCAVSGQ